METTKWSNRKPAGSRIDAEGQFVCAHRDVSCCDACANKYANILDVRGAHYWMETVEEFNEMAEILGLVVTR